MRIDKGPNAIEQLASMQQRAAAHESVGKRALSKTESSQTTVDLKSVESLLGVVADSTQIRESVVADVKRRFQTGELLTRQAAEETARAIQNFYEPL
ncbi:MAG: hypothetical protein NXI32_16520 [bacterium]|nr:hypothetical protein [bacterium]